MRKLLSLFFIIVIGYAVTPNISNAATQRVAIKLHGRYCLFHVYDIEQALKRVSGVLGVDFEAVRGNVIVVMTAGKVNPDHLLSAIQQIKGEGYYCTGHFDGEPGKVEY